MLCISRQNRCVVGKGNCGDFEVLRADADALALEVIEMRCRLRIKRKHGHSAINGESSRKRIVRRDKSRSGLHTRDFCHPAAHLFLINDNTGDDTLFGNGAETQLQTQGIRAATP